MMMKNRVHVNIICRNTTAKTAHAIALCRVFSVLLLTVQSDLFT